MCSCEGIAGYENGVFKFSERKDEEPPEYDGSYGFDENTILDTGESDVCTFKELIDCCVSGINIRGEPNLRNSMEHIRAVKVSKSVYIEFTCGVAVLCGMEQKFKTTYGYVAAKDLKPFMRVTTVKREIMSDKEDFGTLEVYSVKVRNSKKVMCAGIVPSGGHYRVKVLVNTSLYVPDCVTKGGKEDDNV